jgi:protease I
VRKVANKLQGKRVAFLATDMVEQVELTEPWKSVKDAGATPELVSLEEDEIQGFNHYDKAAKFTVDRTVEEARADDYDALVIPAGTRVAGVRLMPRP